jgi:SnoaL-like domain
MKRLVGVPLPPLARGVGLTPLPRPERLYFWFGEPIETARFDTAARDEDARELRDEVERAVQSGIAVLQDERDHDPRRGVLRRLRPVQEEDSGAEADPGAFFMAKAFEAWNEGGPEGVAPWMADSVRLVDPPRWPSSDTWVGREAAVRRLGEVSRELHATQAEIVKAETLDGSVVVSFNVRSDRGPGVELDFCALVDVEGDLIQRMQVFVDEADARAAVGRRNR